MKEKYITEKIPVWYIFGQKDGLVDISNGNDIANGVQLHAAECLIVEHNRCINALIAAIGDDGEALLRAVEAYRQ